MKTTERLRYEFKLDRGTRQLRGRVDWIGWAMVLALPPLILLAGYVAMVMVLNGE